MISFELFLLRVVSALIFGFLIGLEREWRNKNSGIRINSLVSMGSAVFVLISFKVVDGNDDVTRIIGQVVTGIGFIGAGVIFRQGVNVHGLNSAATIWCSSAIGCLCAAGLLQEAVLSAGLVLFTNVIILPLEKWLAHMRLKKRIKKGNGKLVTLNNE